jgi:putative ATPase
VLWQLSKQSTSWASQKEISRSPRLLFTWPTAPKSNALYEAYSRVQEDVQKTRNEPIPLQIRNAPTRLMQDLDYGKDYKYAHDYYKDMQIDDPERPPATQLQDYLPESLQRRRYYEPGHQGKEASIKQWLEKRQGSQ